MADPTAAERIAAAKIGELLPLRKTTREMGRAVAAALSAADRLQEPGNLPPLPPKWSQPLLVSDEAVEAFCRAFFPTWDEALEPDLDPLFDAARRRVRRALRAAWEAQTG